MGMRTGNDGEAGAEVALKRSARMVFWPGVVGTGVSRHSRDREGGLVKELVVGARDGGGGDGAALADGDAHIDGCRDSGLPGDHGHAEVGLGVEFGAVEEDGIGSGARHDVRRIGGLWARRATLNVLLGVAKPVVDPMGAALPNGTAAAALSTSASAAAATGAAGER